MNLLGLTKALLPPAVHDALFRVRQKRALRRHLRGEIDHWGYLLNRRQLIQCALSDPRLVQLFRHGQRLPAGYGINVDERCVEYIWILAHLVDEPGVLLDAGSTLNHEEILQYWAFQRKTIHIMTLEPEVNCYWHKKISYIFGDLRQVPIRDDLYDTIVCCSVLEHIGLDNTVFTQVDGYHENAPDDFILVMREFRRLLKPGGTLLLTVPFGQYHHAGWYQQFDWPLLNRAITAFGQASTIDECYYRHFPDGWNVAQLADCAECQYQERGLLSRADAIACVQIVK